ncbi:MAG TPA: hypothetical protein VLD37_05320, partial [Candidatus Bilamarchaeum sp.]|nr:hypothetical protein [Candidatus Bilamarchaeum sp.]
SIVQDPEVWKLSYKGLDLTSEDRKNLKFEIKTSDKDISASKGPVTSCSDGTDPTFYPTGGCGAATPVQAACTIYAPYVQVTSGDSGSVFQVDRSDVAGDLSDDEFFVAMEDSGAFSGAACDAQNDGDSDDDGLSGFGAFPVGTDLGLPAGTVFMKISSSSDDYGFFDYFDVSKASFGTEVEYDQIGDGDNAFTPPNGGAILIEDEDDVDGGAADEQLGELLTSTGAGSNCGVSTAAGCSDFYFAIAEKAGTGSSNEFVDYFVFGIDQTGTGSPGDATFDFDSTDGGTQTLTSDNEEVLYGHAVSNPADGGVNGYYAGPVDSGPVDDGLEVVEEQYVSERGSVFKTIDDNKVEFDMAHKLARAQWFLAPASTSAGDASKTVVTLGEGESTTVSGVTVKVLEITESVGACSASGGSVSCTADMSGVSAVIMPNNAPSVTVAMPYTGSYGNLVILDSDAVGVNTLVSVGGDKVNSVTASLLEGSAVNWDTEPKVVREVVQGSKIVVAGKEAADTLAAAQDFVAQVKKV